MEKYLKVVKGLFNTESDSYTVNVYDREITIVFQNGISNNDFVNLAELHSAYDCRISIESSTSTNRVVSKLYFYQN
jgi:hypothetical protein